MKVFSFLILFLCIAFSHPSKHQQQYYIPFLKNGLYGFCDTNKKIVFEPHYAYLEFFDSFGFSRFKIINNETSPMGLLDINFNNIVKPIYSQIQCNSHFIIVTDSTENRNKQLLNRNGQVILKNLYTNIIASHNFVKCVYENRNHEMYRFDSKSKKLESIVTVKNGNAMFKYGADGKVKYIYYYDQKNIFHTLDTLGQEFTPKDEPLPQKTTDSKESNSYYSCKIIKSKDPKKTLKGIEIYNLVKQKTDSISPIYSFVKIIYDENLTPFFILKLKKYYGLMDVKKNWVLRPEYDSIVKIDTEYLGSSNLLLKTKKNSRWRFYFEQIKHDEKINSFHGIEPFENSYFITDLNARKGIATIKNNKIKQVVNNSYYDIIQIYYLPNGKVFFKVEDFQKRQFWTDGEKNFLF